MVVLVPQSGWIGCRRAYFVQVNKLY